MTTNPGTRSDSGSGSGTNPGTGSGSGSGSGSGRERALARYHRAFDTTGAARAAHLTASTWTMTSTAARNRIEPPRLLVGERKRQP